MTTTPRTMATVGVLGLAALTVGGAWQSANSLQSQVTHKATAALRAAGVSGVFASADGADVVLTAADGVDLDAARDVVAQVPEVGAVRVGDGAAPPSSVQADEQRAPSGPTGSEGGPSAEGAAPGQGASSGAPSGSPSAALPPSSGTAMTSRSAPLWRFGTADSIQFADGSADLSLEAKNQVRAIVTHMTENPDVMLAAVGVAGDKPDLDSSLALSTQRAKNVTQAVVAGGIAPARVSYTGTGALVGSGRSTGERRVDVMYEEQ